MNFKSIQNLEEAALLIAELNSEAHHHTGYCGIQKDEILHTLTHNFSDLPLNQSLFGAYQNHDLIGILGLDIDKEEREAEIWGPFIKAENWNEIAFGLWQALIDELPFTMKTFHAFYNIENQDSANFMKELDFQAQNKHVILNALSSNFYFQPDDGVQDLTAVFHTQFKNLHEQVFPYTYYNGQDILKLLDENSKVLISTTDGELQGYIFYSANPDFQEGNIEYIRVHPNHRQKGIGRLLLKTALNELFTKYGLREISLCVSFDNKRAINLYKSAGFFEKDFLIHYRKNE